MKKNTKRDKAIIADSQTLDNKELALKYGLSVYRIGEIKRDHLRAHGIYQSRILLNKREREQFTPKILKLLDELREKTPVISPRSFCSIISRRLNIRGTVVRHILKTIKSEELNVVSAN